MSYYWLFPYAENDKIVNNLSQEDPVKGAETTKHEGLIQDAMKSEGLEENKQEGKEEMKEDVKYDISLQNTKPMLQQTSKKNSTDSLAPHSSSCEASENSQLPAQTQPETRNQVDFESESPFTVAKVATLQYLPHLKSESDENDSLSMCRSECSSLRDLSFKQVSLVYKNTCFIHYNNYNYCSFTGTTLICSEALSDFSFDTPQSMVEVILPKKVRFFV